MSTPTDALTSQTGPTRSFSYDSDGNMTNRGSDTLTYDGLGRLHTTTVNSTTSTYTYDPAGNLKTRVTSSPAKTINYLLGDLLETDTSGTITSSYQDGPAGDLTSYNGPPTSSSTPTYQYYDGHGDLAAEQTGTTLTTHTNDPFGAPTDTPPTNTTTHRYTGKWNKQYDTSNNLILMGARPYDPTLGRFTAIDPIDGGSLNNYDYAGQDPINGYDLDGTCWTGFCWAAHAASSIWAGLKATAPIAIPIFVTALAAGACGGCSILAASAVIGITSGGSTALLDKFVAKKSTSESLFDGGINLAGGTGQTIGKAALKSQVEKLLVKELGQKVASTLSVTIMLSPNVSVPVRGGGMYAR